MVNKYKHRDPLTLLEREKILQGIKSDYSYREIGESIGRAKSTVMREAKRLGQPKDYNPVKAHQNFKKKQMLSGIRRGSALYLKVLEIVISEEGE